MSTSETTPALDTDEPTTPTWFTFLGVLLFLLGGIYLLVTGDEEPATADSGAAASPPIGAAPPLPTLPVPPVADRGAPAHQPDH